MATATLEERLERITVNEDHDDAYLPSTFHISKVSLSMDAVTFGLQQRVWRGKTMLTSYRALSLRQ